MLFDEHLDLLAHEGDEGNEHAADQEHEWVCRGVEAEALRVGDVELLDALVGPLLPHSVLEPALVQFVQPVVEDLSVRKYLSGGVLST